MATGAAVVLQTWMYPKHGRSQRFPWEDWGITAQTQRALETKLPYNYEREVGHVNVLTLVGTWWHVGRIGQCNVYSPILINSKTTGMKIIPSVETSNCAFGKKKKNFLKICKAHLLKHFWRISECGIFPFLVNSRQLLVRPCRAQFDRLEIYICLILPKRFAQKVRKFSEKVIFAKKICSKFMF